MRRIVFWVAGFVFSACLTLAPANAEAIYKPQELVGTNWTSQAPYTWSKIDRFGTFTVLPSDGHLFQITDYHGGVYAVKITWWNIEKKLHFIEYAVMVESDDNVYAYQEVQHEDGSGFTGISGGGRLSIDDENTAKLYQLGNIDGGEAGAFTLELKKVDIAPVVDIPLTYPPQQ